MTDWLAPVDFINPSLRVRPRDGVIDGRRIEPYRNEWTFYGVSPDGVRSPAGQWLDHVEVIAAGERAVLRRTQTVTHPGGPTVTHIDEVDRLSLAPLRVRIGADSAPPILDVRFDGATITGVRPFHPDHAAAPVPAPFEITLPEPVFDWHLWGLLIAGFPLTEGYAAKFLAHAYIPGSPAVLTEVRFIARGEETSHAGLRGDRDCWVVDVLAHFPWRIWIDKACDGPRVVKILIESPDGLQRWWHPPGAGAS